MTAMLALVLGSSPLARGALSLPACHQIVVGIIPACAGSTTGHHERGGQGEDHPRLRGEHTPPPAPRARRRGSSPLARGAPRDGPGSLINGGIIPACAGSTASTRLSTGPRGDHPRLRGEHPFATASGICAVGSSPLARGARGRRESALGVPGIIPACAGSTAGCAATASRARDHPRLRGEHRWVRRYCEPGEGSSPLARGAPIEHKVGGEPGGIIPACAGSTRRRGSSHGRVGDHPRLRGEHWSNFLELNRMAGSSPLARGARSRIVLFLLIPGIIPACAGSTCRPRSGRR